PPVNGTSNKELFPVKLDENGPITMDEKYLPQAIEKKWQERWADQKTFQVTEDPAHPKFYCLEMLAYTSGRAHIGHVSNFAIGDALAWYKRMRGFNVLHPFG